MPLSNPEKNMPSDASLAAVAQTLHGDALAKALKAAGNDAKQRLEAIRSAVQATCAEAGFDYAVLFDPYDLGVQLEGETDARRQQLLSLQIQVSMLKRVGPMPGNALLERSLRLDALGARRRLSLQ